MKKKLIEETEQNLKGLRSSKNRDCVIGILLKSRVPISMEDIFYKAKKPSCKIIFFCIYFIN